MARYLWVMLLTAAAVVGCVASFNVTVDRFRIFHEVAQFEAVEPNTRYWKTTVLGKTCQRYDGYIFGNSRAAVIDPAATGAALGLDMFNYATSDDRINGVDAKLRFLISKGCPVETVLLPISLDYLGPRDWTLENNLLRIEHPDVSGEHSWRFYARYLFTFGVLRMNAQLVELRWQGKDHKELGYASNGRVDYLWEAKEGTFKKCTRDIEVLPEPPTTRAISDELEFHRAIAANAAYHGFKVVPFIVPQAHDMNRLYFELDSIRDFMAALSMIYGEVVNVRSKAGFTNDYRAWHDCSHYKRAAFEAHVLPRIAAVATGETPRTPERITTR